MAKTRLNNLKLTRIRKKGYQQSIGFLTKYSYQHQQDKQSNNNDDINEESALADTATNKLFNLNDFYLKFLPDKFCDMCVLLKRKNRTFLSNNYLTSNNQHSVTIFEV